MKIPAQPIKWLHGDPRWSHISNFASWAPLLVVSLFVLAIIQICLGAVWISKIGADLQFALVLQPLVLPCLALFNTVPSAHLHLYTRTNNPKLSVWFSGIMCVLYFAAAIIDLAACTGSGVYSLRSECPRGSVGDNTTGPNISWNMWDANVALWLLSAVMYGLIVAMAAKVWVYMHRQERAAKDRGQTITDMEREMMSPEEIESRNQKAAERWRKLQGQL